MLVVGDEILSGKVVDVNTPLVVATFRDLGVSMAGIFVIPDQKDAIVDTVRWLKGRFTYIISSGGVGPTHDDVTVEAIAQALDRPLVENPVLVEALRRLYTDNAPAALLKMALLPEGTQLIDDASLRVPVVKVDEIYIFPGAPSVFRRKFLAVREHFRSTPFFTAKLVTRAQEENIAALLAQAESKFLVSVGSYPDYEGSSWSVTITVESKHSEQVTLAAAFIASGLPVESAE